MVEAASSCWQHRSLAFLQGSSLLQSFLDHTTPVAPLLAVAAQKSGSLPWITQHQWLHFSELQWTEWGRSCSRFSLPGVRAEHRLVIRSSFNTTALLLWMLLISDCASGSPCEWTVWLQVLSVQLWHCSQLPSLEGLWCGWGEGVGREGIHRRGQQVPEKGRQIHALRLLCSLDSN